MIGRAFAILLFLFLAAPARADTVADWNRIALDLAVQPDQPLEHSLRVMATVHVAMFEALNFIEGKYRSHYTVRSPGLQGIPAEAAAASAAHQVLAGVYPAQREALGAALKRSLGAIPGGRAAATTGTSIAAVVSAAAPPRSEPWVLGSAELFDLPPARGAVRARYDDNQDPADLHFGTSPLTWNGRVAELASSRGLSPIERARIHALVSMSLADSYALARESGERCAACIATSAVAFILESELGARLQLLSVRSPKIDQDSARQIARYALLRYRPNP